MTMRILDAPSPLVFAAFDGRTDLWAALAVLGVISLLILALVIFAARSRGDGARGGREGAGMSWSWALGPYPDGYAQLVRDGQAITLPGTIPPVPRGAQAAWIRQVRDTVQVLREVPWGQQPTLPESEVQPAFDAAIGRVHVVRADGARYVDLIWTFAAMPAPYSLVGAAAIMQGISYHSDLMYLPEGLMHALLFAAQAQCASPLHPEALVVQVKILAAGRRPEWADLAEHTLALLERVAPNHPRLPAARFACYVARGEYEAALACCHEAQERAPTPEERRTAVKTAADMLWRLKRLDEALVAYDQALTQDADDEWAWHNKSLVLLAVGRPQEAYVCNLRALGIREFGAAQHARQRIVGELRMRNLEPPQGLKWT